MSNFKNKAKAFFGGDGFSGATLTCAVIAVVIAVNVLFYVLTVFLGLYITPAEKDETLLTGATDSLFEQAIADKRKVTISFCYPEEDLKTHDTGAFVYKTANEFKKRYPDFIDIEYINIITKRNSKGELVNLSKYQKDMRGNDTPIYRSSVIFESSTATKNNYIVITDTTSAVGFSNFYTLNTSGEVTSYSGEEFMAAMISWVLQDEHKTAYLTTSHSEQADISFANLLSAAGYYIDVINLKEREVPEDAGLLIISNPRSDFERGASVRTEIERLRSYVKGGGNIFVTLDPYVKRLTVLESFLTECGISFSVADSESGYHRNIVKDVNNAITTDGFTLVADYADNGLSSNIQSTVEDFSDGKVIIREAAALELSNSAKPILISSSASVCEADGKTTATGGSYCIAAYNEIGNGKIMVVPSIYISVSEALVTNGYANKEFLFASFENLFGAKGMPYGCRAIIYNTETLENLTMGTARLYTAMILAIPAAIAVTGAVVIIRRKNR